MILTNRAYDILKWMTMIALPSSATLYFALASIWGWPYIAEVTGSIAAITAFVGALIGVSTYQYNKTQ